MPKCISVHWFIWGRVEDEKCTNCYQAQIQRYYPWNRSKKPGWEPPNTIFVKTTEMLQSEGEEFKLKWASRGAVPWKLLSCCLQEIFKSPKKEEKASSVWIGWKKGGEKFRSWFVDRHACFQAYSNQGRERDWKKWILDEGLLGDD